MTQKFESHGYVLEFEKTEEKSLLVLDFEEGPQECYLIDIFSVDDKDYIALVPVDSDELMIFNYDFEMEDQDEFNLSSLENEEELDLVYHLFSHYWDEETIDALIEEYKSDSDFIDMDDEEDDNE